MRLTPPAAFAALALAAAVSFLASCAAPATSYYLLNAEGPVPSTSGIGIGVGPVSLAGYLERQNLVLEEADNQLTVAADHRWAGDLADNIARTTATNLGRQLRTGNVRSYPWEQDNGLRYQVSLDIQRFHASTDGEAVIEATWRVYSLPDRSLASTRAWSGTEPLTADGYKEVVAAESRLLARLAAEIAKGLK